MNAANFAVELLRELQALNGGNDDDMPQRVPLRHITEALRNITAKHRDDVQLSKEEAQALIDAALGNDNDYIPARIDSLYSGIGKLRRLAE